MHAREGLPSRAPYGQMEVFIMLFGPSYPTFPSFGIKFVAIAVLASIGTVSYAAYKLYSHGVEFAEFQNQAQANERAKIIVELQQKNLLALREDEKQAREEKEKYQQERNTLQARVDAAKSQIQDSNTLSKQHAEELEKYKAVLADKDASLEEQQMAIERLEEENKTCKIDDIIILPQLNTSAIGILDDGSRSHPFC